MTDISIVNSGTKLAASVFGPPDGQPVLFLHGISMSRDTWEEAVPRLSNGYNVWTLDFRGHGHSARASNYDITDYVSDAEAALAVIGRPTVLVGHSLGGCVAGVLAQSGSPLVRGALLEDPPWYLGDPVEWNRSAFPKLFAVVSEQQATLQRETAPLAAYLSFVSNAPSPLGGIASDHFSQRHLLSHASALQRQDVSCWGNVTAANGGMLAAIRTNEGFKCPVKVIQADNRFGAALLAGHEVRLSQTNPRTEIVHYEGSGHRPHAATEFEARFRDDLETFLSGLGR